MNNILIGQYIPGNSYLYKIDPRAKIISLIVLMISAFLLETLPQILVAFGLILIILLTGKISFFKVLKGLKTLLFLLSMTFLFQIFLNRTGNVIYSELFYLNYINISLIILFFVGWRLLKRYIDFPFLLFFAYLFIVFFVQRIFTNNELFSYSISIYEGGLKMSFFIMIRLIIIITLSTVLTLTTKPTDLTLGLEYLLKPLKIVKIDAEEIAMIISIALRFIPTLFDEANKIMAAQASRGVDFTEGKIKDKITQVISLLIPMFIISFKRSDDLANAMDARCFKPGERRTRIVLLRWKLCDTIAIFLVISSLVVAIIV